MATITSGNSATVQLAAGDSVLVTTTPNVEGSTITTVAGQANAAPGVVLSPYAARFGPPAMSRTIGPFGTDSTVVIASTLGTVTYTVTIGNGGSVTILTAGQIASPTADQLANTVGTYQLNVTPYTRYQSNGTALVPMGGGGGVSLTAANNWSLAQTSSLSAIAYAATITLDGLTHSNHVNIGALTGALTLASPTNFTNAATLNVWITQDATGSRLLTLGAAIKTAGGAGITLSTAANAVDVVSLVYNPTKAIWFAAIAKAVA